MAGNTEGENGRVDLLYEEIRALRQDQQEAFNRLESKISDTRGELNDDNKDITQYCHDRRKEIYERLDKLEKNFFKILFIGGGVGFIFGTVCGAFLYAFFG